MYKISIEDLHYQNKDSYINEAISLIDKIVNSIEKNGYTTDFDLLTKETKLINNLSNSLRKRFGINSTIIVNPKLFLDQPGVLVPIHTELKDYTLINDIVLNTNVNDYINGKKTELLNKDINKSIINFKQGYIKGYYSQIEILIYINFYTLYKTIKLSSEEILAVLLHEVGHIFNGFTYHYKVNKTNLIATQVINELRNNNIDKAIYVLNNNLDKDNYIKNNISDKEIRNDIAASIAKLYMNLEHDNSIAYLNTNNEAVADNFVVKFNLGEELSVALDKVNEYNFNKYGVISKKEHKLVLIKLISIIILISLFVSVVLINPSVGISYIFIILLTIFNYEKENGNIYDDARTRFIRIKQGIINNLKNTNLDKTTINILIKQVEDINTIIQSYKPENNLLKRLVFGSKYIKFKSLQNDLEELLNNDTFFFSAKLKTI